MNKYISLIIRIVLYIVCLGGVLYYLYNSPYNPHPKSAEDIRLWVSSFGYWAPFIYVCIYTIRPMLFFPTLILNLSAGILFGPYLGVLLLLMGGLGCSCFCYAMGRFGGGSYLLDNWSGKWGSRLKRYLTGHGSLKKLLWLRTVPIFPYDPVSVIAGSVKLDFGIYVLGTFLGMLPGALAYNFLADSLGTPRFYLAIGGIFLAFGIPFILWGAKRKWRRDELGK